MSKILELIRRVWNWLYAKRSEVAQMDYRDAFMAHLVLEIMQTSPKPQSKFMNLYQLIPIHPVDNRANTIRATRERALKVARQKERLLKEKNISKDLLAEVLPSATYIKVVPDGTGNYFCFEGNGRIAALKQVFSEEDGIAIEADLFEPRKLRRIQKKVKQLRKLHAM